MDWLNENALRDYPFTAGTAMTPYPAAIVDAVFTLGSSIPFDFDNDTAELVLDSVSMDGAGYHLTFSYREYGATVGQSLVFTVPHGYPMHGVVAASVGDSRGYITVGDITGLPVGSYGAAVELRTVTATVDQQSAQIAVYNAARRGSYAPYAPSGEGMTPAQLYAAAKAAAPAWAKNMCLENAVGALSGDIVLKGGFNVNVDVNPAVSTITWSMDTAKSGSGCGVRGYVASRLGTNDPVADIDGDGLVTEADVALVDAFPVSPLEISSQGVLRMINGRGANRGDLRLVAGPGVSISVSAEQYAVILEVGSMSIPTKCL